MALLFARGGCFSSIIFGQQAPLICYVQERPPAGDVLLVSGELQQVQ